MTSEAEGARVDLQARARAAARRILSFVTLDWTDSHVEEGAALVVALAADEASRADEALKMLDEAAVTMRNYYGHAISRATVEAFLERVVAFRQLGASQPQPAQPETPPTEWGRPVMISLRARVEALAEALFVAGIRSGDKDGRPRLIAEGIYANLRRVQRMDLYAIPETTLPPGVPGPAKEARVSPAEPEKEKA